MIAAEMHPLGIAIVVETVIATLCFTFVLGSAAANTVVARRSRPQHDRANQLVSTFLETTTISDADRKWLRSRSAHRRIELFARFAGTFEGEELDRLHDLARLTGLANMAAKCCRSRRWSRRLAGARLFTMIGGGRASVMPLFQDRNDEVRAGAAEWAANNPDPDVINELVVLLSDASGFCRFSVKDSFVRLGPLAATAVLAHLESTPDPSDESLEVAAWISDIRLLPVAIRLLTHSASRKRALALALVASIGGEEALSATVSAVDDEDADVRIAALRALGRMGHWNVAPNVAKALRDQEWNVRFEAATTLHALGAPGALLLSRATRDPDPFTSDMARHILDVSAATTRTAS